MKHLCIDARMVFSSGIGTYIRELVPFFSEKFHLTLLVDQLGYQSFDSFEQIVFKSPIYSLKEQVLFPLIIPDCDLFFSPHYNVPLLPIRARRRIATIHDVCHLIFGSFFEKRYAKFMLRQALSRSNQVITVSHFSKNQIEMHLGKGPINVILIAANLERFKRKPFSEKIRKKYNLPHKFVLFVGNRKPHKNLTTLQLAFQQIKELKLELVVIGKGTEYGRVPDEELPFFYSMAEVLVFPSLYEGFGLPPLEAMSCGCPTIVARAGSIPEVCAEASLYFDPLNPKQIADAIYKVMNDQDLKKTLIRKGFEQVQRFSWKQTASAHLKLFEKEFCA